MVVAQLPWASNDQLLGHETSASALTWAIYLLASHPQIQARPRDEVRSFLPAPLSDSLQIVASDNFEKMPYLNAVCREVLRLFPPVAVTMRVAVKDTTICGQLIPKNTTVMLSPWAVNARTALWGDDAGEFRPERWLSGKDSDRSNTNYDFLTFLHGPRSCIGQSFAMGELACLVAAWIGAFATEMRDEGYVPVVKGSFTAKPKNGLYVRIKRVVL